jgi:hypothetical protein
MDKPFVSPTGYVDLDNDCEYSIDLKSTRSRESVIPKEDLNIYFQTYIIPKYGLNNINVSNVASFMKDLEMNWTKIPDNLKEQVLNIFVDSILANDSSFKTSLLNKLGNVGNVGKSTFDNTNVKSTFGNTNVKSQFGFPTKNSVLNMFIVIAVLIFIFFILDKIILQK